jgi:hypothetical protein
MSDISNQLIKDSYNYVLQSDLSTGVVYRIGGTIPVNPIFQSGLTVNSGFTYSNGTEGVGYALLTDGTGYAYWAPVSAATPSSGVTSVTATNGLSGNVTTGAVTIVNTAPDQTVTISGGTGITTGGTYPNFTLVNSAPDKTVTITGGTNIQITGTYPDFGVNYTGATITQGITGITGTSGISASTTDYGTTIINTAPDRTVTLSGGTNIGVTGTYPDFSISFTGSTPTQGITAITATNGVSANTSNNTTTIINTAPDQTVIITGGTNIQITGTYPSFGVNFTGSTTGGTTIQGITGITGTSGVSANTTDYGTTIINTAPDRTVTITGGTNVQITGTYPDFGVNFTGTSATDTYVTGFTLSSNTITLSQNRSDSYSAFTISLSAYTGSTGGGVGGSGTTSYVPKWSNSTTLTDSKIYDNGTSIGVGTASPNAAAIVEIASTTQGVLFPRMTKVQRDAITSPPIGLMLFVTDDNEGLYIYKTSGWVQII